MVWAWVEAGEGPAVSLEQVAREEMWSGRLEAGEGMVETPLWEVETAWGWGGGSGCRGGGDRIWKDLDCSIPNFSLVGSHMVFELGTDPVKSVGLASVCELVQIRNNDGGQI